MDIANIIRVVQYMVPSSLSVFLQRLGRAGRNKEPAIGILLVEPSVFQTMKKKLPKGSTKDNPVKVEDIEVEIPDGDDEDNLDLTAPTNRKKVEQGMREWIETPICQREVSDSYFQNPPRTTRTFYYCIFVFLCTFIIYSIDSTLLCSLHM